MLRIIVVVFSSVLVPPAIALDSKLTSAMHDILKRVASADAIEFGVLIPRLEQTYQKTTDRTQKMVSAHRLALLYLITDNYQQSAFYATELNALAVAQNNETMISIAALIKASALSREQRELDAQVVSKSFSAIQMKNNLKLRANYYIISKFNNLG